MATSIMMMFAMVIKMPLLFYNELAILIYNIRNGDQDASVVLQWTGNLDFDDIHIGDQDASVIL